MVVKTGGGGGGVAGESVTVRRRPPSGFRASKTPNQNPQICHFPDIGGP